MWALRCRCYPHPSLPAKNVTELIALMRKEKMWGELIASVRLKGSQ